MYKTQMVKEYLRTQKINPENYDTQKMTQDEYELYEALINLLSAEGLRDYSKCHDKAMQARAIILKSLDYIEKSLTK